jgi:hypothetical protein
MCLMLFYVFGRLPSDGPRGNVEQRLKLQHYQQSSLQIARRTNHLFDDLRDTVNTSRYGPLDSNEIVGAHNHYLII